MEYKLAKNFGFCFGVKRAIKIAESSPDSYIFGPLIHNQKEIDRLKNDFSAVIEEDISKFNSDDRVIIRTHGIEKHNLETLKEKNIDIINATCPYVTKPQKIVEKMSEEGYTIVIFGDEAHPEVKGVKSYSATTPYVILDPIELKDKKLKDKVAIVAQTTKKKADFLKIVDYLVENYREVRVFNTICNATLYNQEAVAELSKEVDVLLVIGGKNSSNTKQLHDIALKECKDSYLIESFSDIDESWLKGKKCCGVTAGASTPKWIVDEVLETISKL